MTRKPNRREFLKGGAMVTVAAATTRTAGRTPAGPRNKSAIVVGAGVFGGWTALNLRRAGWQVTLADAWGPGNSRASSGGETRVIRATYGPSRLYTRMAAESLRLWIEHEKRVGIRLFHRTGALWMAGKDDAYERAALPVLAGEGVEHEKLEAREGAKRWPQIDFFGVQYCLWEPEAGYLMARRGCETVLDQFLKEGGAYVQAAAELGAIAGKELQDVTANDARGQQFRGDAYIFACGPWLGRVIPELATAVRPSRQEVLFFGPPAGDARFNEDKLPVWIDNSARLYYGIPGNEWRGFKIADDTRGSEFDPTNGDRVVSAAGIAAAREYLAQRFPGMRSAPLVEGRVCQYENSADHDFILDRLPAAENVWVVGGGSGHGFKHGPAVGRMVANAVTGKEAPPKEFGLARLSGTSRTGTGAWPPKPRAV